MKFLIAGTGRSGTKWCAVALRSVGYHVAHEQFHTTDGLVGDDVPQSWPASIDGEASLAVVPFLGWWRGIAERLLVVRHPLDVAGSIATVGPLLAESQPVGLCWRIRRDHPEVYDQPDEIHAAAAYWLAWNRRAWAHVDGLVDIETLTVDRLCTILGLSPRWEPIPGLRPVGAGPERTRPTWDDLTDPLRSEVADLAAQFGYEDLP